MVPLSAVVCLAFLALAEATYVRQCRFWPIRKPFANLDKNVQISPCDESRCELKRNSDYNFTIAFEPEKDVNYIESTGKYIYGLISGSPTLADAFDDTSICDKVFTPAGDKSSCPLKAGTKYVYKASFKVSNHVPTVGELVLLEWALWDNNKERDFLMCFQINLAME